MQIRPEVMRLAEAMERRLRINKHKGHWEYEQYDYLLGRLKEETDELEKIIPGLCATDKAQKAKVTRILNEAADIANFAMMIADNYYKEEKTA